MADDCAWASPWSCHSCTFRGVPLPTRVAKIVTEPDDRAGWVQAGPDHAIPTRFYGWAELADPPCMVRLDVIIDTEIRTPVVRELIMERQEQTPAGPPITASLLRRVTLDELLRRMLLDVQERIVSLDRQGYTGVFQLARDAESGSTVAYGGRRLAPTSGRDRRTADEKLRQVADVYRAAMAAGKPPTKAVAEQLHYKRAHAGRLVMQARRASYLGPTVKGKAGAQ